MRLLTSFPLAPAEPHRVARHPGLRWTQWLHGAQGLRLRPWGWSSTRGPAGASSLAPQTIKTCRPRLLFHLTDARFERVSMHGNWLTTKRASRRGLRWLREKAVSRRRNHWQWLGKFRRSRESEGALFRSPLCEGSGCLFSEIARWYLNAGGCCCLVERQNLKSDEWRPVAMRRQRASFGARVTRVRAMSWPRVCRVFWGGVIS